jgi:hypothetical protein
MASPVRHPASFPADILLSYRRAGSLSEIANDNRPRPDSAGNKAKRRRLHAVLSALVGLIRLAIRRTE